MADLIESTTWTPSIYQIETTDPVVGGPPNLALGQGISNVQAQQLASRTAYLKKRLDDKELLADIEVTVGATGDYQSINAALADLSKMAAGYSSSRIKGTIRLLAGFVMEEQIVSNQAGLGWIEIVGDDAETTIARDALTFGATYLGYPAFGALVGGSLPVISQLFAMDNTGPGTERNGISGLAHADTLMVTAGAGVKNAGGFGAFVGVGSAWFDACDFSGAGTIGLLVSSGAVVHASSFKADDCGTRGAEVRLSSSCSLQSCSLRRAGVEGLRVGTSSNVVASSGDARKVDGVDGSSDFVVFEGGVLTARNVTGGTNIAANTVTTNGIIFQ